MFLAEIANLSDDPVATSRLNARFPDIVPGRAWWVDQQKKAIEEMHQAKLADDEIIKDLHLKHLLEIRDTLRLIWAEPDLRKREWLVFRLRDELMARADPGLAHAGGGIMGISLLKRLPPPTAFEQALIVLFKSADRARYCNNPDCPAPYFFARRRTQKYCSDACALPAQREFKRKWWKEHGDHWRAKRQTKRPHRRKGK